MTPNLKTTTYVIILALDYVTDNDAVSMNNSLLERIEDLLDKCDDNAYIKYVNSP